MAFRSDHTSTHTRGHVSQSKFSRKKKIEGRKNTIARKRQKRGLSMQKMSAIFRHFVASRSKFFLKISQAQGDPNEGGCCFAGHWARFWWVNFGMPNRGHHAGCS